MSREDDDLFDHSEFPCFACGGVTVPLNTGRFCIPCQVYEERLIPPYVSRTRTMTEVDRGVWAGVPYLDHSRGHYPSP